MEVLLILTRSISDMSKESVVSGADTLSFFRTPSCGFTTVNYVFKERKIAAMTIQTNKDSSQSQYEGVSAPETMERKAMTGSVTTEASFGIPLFLFAAVCLIWLIEIRSIRLSMLNAAQNAAKSAAEETAVIPVLNTVKLKSDITDLIGEERVERSIIRGGSSGISCWKSHVSPSTGDMMIIVDYDIQLPLPLFGSPAASMREEFTLSAWRGDQTIKQEDGESRIVYVTDNGAVYHEDYHCSYLQLSIRFVPSGELDYMRNEGGGKYHACDKCVFGPAMAGVYITDDGTKYHNSLNCSGLKRSIHAVEYSEAAGKGGCSRCSG